MSSIRTIRRLIQNGDLAMSGSSAEDVAHALRIRCPELCRQNLKPFTAVVRRVLSTIPSPSSSGSDDDDDFASPHRRHLDAHATTFSATALSKESSHQPPPPAFDITKTMLRSQYASHMPKRNPGTNQELEIEVTSEKARRLNTSYGGGRDAKTEALASEGVVTGDKGPSFAEGVTTGDKGPNFADLGRMETVIEQLMMEVVVPLCHPELPRHLGVRPIAGLVLHGPPGCGKTTLAHAIANETGVPFHKISAPEIMNGVPDTFSDFASRFGKLLTRCVYLDEQGFN